MSTLEFEGPPGEEGTLRFQREKAFEEGLLFGGVGARECSFSPPPHMLPVIR